jgi:Pvc16 N-terminal domain
MSNALAIAHVTQALALLLASNVGPEFDEAVKVEPHKPPTEPPDYPTLNVFLYQVTPNTSMRNNDPPTRASDGTLVKRPVAALDLHYLISAYGDETTLVGQRLIGSVVRTLHEIPILPKDVIEETGQLPHLAGSDLAETTQRVRFTPTVMDIDETSKLWGMLHQTPYSLSVVYQATLVLIDGREKPVPAKPVERTDVRVLPFGAPGAPVPPGAEPRAEEPSAGGPASGAVHSEAPAPAGKEDQAVVEKKAPVGTKKAAKAVAKAPARTRKTPARTPRSARPAPRKADDADAETEQ